MTRLQRRGLRAHSRRQRGRTQAPLWALGLCFPRIPTSSLDDGTSSHGQLGTRVRLRRCHPDKEQCALPEVGPRAFHFPTNVLLSLLCPSVPRPPALAAPDPTPLRPLLNPSPPAFWTERSSSSGAGAQAIGEEDGDDDDGDNRGCSRLRHRAGGSHLTP